MMRSFARKTLPLLAIMIVAGSLGPVNAQGIFRSPTERDPDTNLLCVDQSCTTLRHSERKDCICTKQGGGTNSTRNVRLECFAKEGGQWVSCPLPAFMRK